MTSWGFNQQFARDLELLKKTPEWCPAISSSFRAKYLPYYKLTDENIQSQNFIKEFVKYCIFKQRNQLNHISGQISNGDIQIPEQFLIECIFIALLDLNENIGTLDDILSKLIECLPILGSLKLRSIIENILKSTCCFKRLLNIMCSKKPSILAKRNYYWSIDYEYLKLFVKYFEGRYQKCDLNNNNSEEEVIIKPYSISAKQTVAVLDENTNKTNESAPLLHARLFDMWKSQVENYKTFMEIKHSRFSWLLQSSWLSSAPQCGRRYVDFDQLDFVKLVRLRNEETKKSRQLRGEPKWMLAKPVQIPVQAITTANKLNQVKEEEKTKPVISLLEMRVRKRKQEETRAPPPSPQKKPYEYDSSQMKPSLLKVALTSEPINN